jgi:transposase
LVLLDGVKPVAGKVGRPRKRPDALLADRGYDYDKYRREVSARGIKPVIAKRNTEHGSGLGRHRWVVERTFTWLHTSSDDYESAGSATPNNTSRSSTSPPQSSAGDASSHYETGSKTGSYSKDRVPRLSAYSAQRSRSHTTPALSRQRRGAPGTYARTAQRVVEKRLA